MSDLKLTIEKARQYYFQEWRGNEKICPAFGEIVYVTRVGWNHIVHHKRRLIVDKVIRLKKLPLAREVLESATTYQTVQTRGEYTLYGIKAIKGDTVVKVVVSQKIGSSKKVLFSIMFRNVKRHKEWSVKKHNKNLIR
ncbi:MAG: hypothetical protein UX99_C0011G0001 [Candidatus Amesbacteria bacterium GW2011_GWB1_47_26]|nr:MAG: hypothetical protein UX99_C0011G0001 [Candidatus Amesbacteria bacterium GW2011_GWB1_47_26]